MQTQELTYLNELHNKVQTKQATIAIVGLGYVGLPITIEFAHHYPTIGFDISKTRINELHHNIDITNEITTEGLAKSKATFTQDTAMLKQADIIIVTVPTPIDDNNQPDLTPIKAASKTVGKWMKEGCCVVYESTVYPGVTEDICVPILEEESNLKHLDSFWVGYSPERINPGDKVHTLTQITKVVSGDCPDSAKLLTDLYGSIIEAGIHTTSSIQIAEASKVIENTQRDLNIALMNELAIIFKKAGIPTQEVLEAAGTKWNFLPFVPGLVGGHCIGVDPYYLTHKAEQLGYNPQVILAGRRINNSMGKYIAEQTIKEMIKAEKKIKNTRVLLLGITFKENVPDIRNTRVINIINELKEYGIHTLVHDPYADPEETKKEYNIELVELDAITNIDTLIVCNSHNMYKDTPLKKLLAQLTNPNTTRIVMDLKSIYKNEVETSSINNLSYWRI